MILLSDPTLLFTKKKLNSFSKEVERWTTDQEDVQSYRANWPISLSEMLVSPQCYINYEQSGHRILVCREVMEILRELQHEEKCCKSLAA